jgi:hypothetical protein
LLQGRDFGPDSGDIDLKRRLDMLQVLLGGNVVVDRVEDLGGDALGLLTFDICARQGIGQ